MDAVEFLKATRRLCAIHRCDDGCPLIDSCDDDTEDGYARKVRTVEQWAKEHPVKTRQSEFLKICPNANLDDNGVLLIAPCDVYQKEKTNGCWENGCDKCFHDFWLKEIE